MRQVKVLTGGGGTISDTLPLSLLFDLPHSGFMRCTAFSAMRYNGCLLHQALASSASVAGRVVASSTKGLNMENAQAQLLSVGIGMLRMCGWRLLHR